MFRIAVKILRARIGLETNSSFFLLTFPLKVAVESLLTDFKEVKEIKFSEGLDGYVQVKNSSGKVSYSFKGGTFFLKGPLLKISREASDSRYTLWGNQGLIYRYTLYLLERNYGIFNLHACALLDEKKNMLYVVAGGAGAGKTVFLLSGLQKGLKLFSTETLHFTLKNKDLCWYMGSLVDNIRWSTLFKHFPQFLPTNEVEESKERGEKIAVDLSFYRTDKEELHNPRFMIIFPRIEEGWPGCQRTKVVDKRKGAKLIFDNISQKLAETVILYDRIPLAGMDCKSLALARLEAVRSLLDHESMVEITLLLSNPQECWGNLLD